MIVHYGRNDPLCGERGSHVRTELVDDATCVACLRGALKEAQAVLAEISILDVVDGGPSGQWNVDSLPVEWWVDDDSIDDFGVWLVEQARERAKENRGAVDTLQAFLMWAGGW